MHVCRRDYLWDRLSTIGCCVIFFHPLAWLARRRLRWERELVCDESVAQGSEESRLEYASCLTTLASWWFLEKEAAGQVDFLSSPPSLLAVRVRSILTQQPTYGSCKKAVLTLLAATAVSAQVVLVPEIGISSYPSLPLKVASQQSPLSLERAHAHRKHAIRRRNQLASFALAPMMQSWSSAPNFNFPVRLPVLSPSPTEQGHPSERLPARRQPGQPWNPRAWRVQAPSRATILNPQGQSGMSLGRKQFGDVHPRSVLSPCA